MKLKEPILRHLCKKYGISGHNEDELVLRYLSQYSNIDVCCKSHREEGGRSRTFFVTRINNGKKENTWIPVLEFKPSLYYAPADMGWEPDPDQAVLFDVDGDMAHVFIGSGGGRDYSRKAQAEAMWKLKEEADRQVAVARAQKQEVATPKVQRSNSNFFARLFRYKTK